MYHEVKEKSWNLVKCRPIGVRIYLTSGASSQENVGVAGEGNP